MAITLQLRHLALVLGGISLLALLALTILAPRPAPASANPLTGVSQVSAGVFHSCAVTATGNAKCWGNNSIFGLLGNGSTIDSLIPVDVTGLTTGTDSIVAAEHLTCALTTGGGVKCWGSNFDGQLGDGTTGTSTVPADVVGLSSGVGVMDVGTSHVCVVMSLGDVKCWGSNGYGQLGGTAPGFSSTPIDATVLTTAASDVAPGGRHTCAVTTAEAVECWGDDTFGQLSDGSLTSGMLDVSSGALHSCVLTTAGGAKCWGFNAQGQLGDGSTTDSSAPTDVAGLTSGVVAVDAGGLQSCAVTSGGAVKCWGGGYGPTPVEVPGFSDAVVDVSVGLDHVCALTATDEAHCWGNNGRGQLGDGTTVSRTTPVSVIELVAKPTATPTPCPPAGCPTPTQVPVCAADACMDLVVLDASGNELCRSSGNTKCEISTGDSFTAVVDAVAVPSVGYIQMQTFVDFGENLTYKPSEFAKQEMLWPDCQTATVVRFQIDLTLPAPPLGGSNSDEVVAHGCLTGLVAPIPTSHYSGNVVQFTLTCSTDPSSNLVELLPYVTTQSQLPGEVAGTNGALFTEPDSSQTLPLVGNLTVNCVDAAPAAVGGVALSGELRGIAAHDRTAPWLWATLGFGAIVAMSALAIAGRHTRSR